METEVHDLKVHFVDASIALRKSGSFYLICLNANHTPFINRLYAPVARYSAMAEGTRYL